MKSHLTLLGSVVLFTSVGLTACDSATATNEKATVDVKKTVVEEVQKVAEAAPVAVQEEVKKIVEAVPAAADVKEAVVAKAEEVKADVVAKAVEVKDEVVAEVTSAPATEAVVAAAPETAVQAVVAKVDESQFKEGTHYFEIFPTMQTDSVGGKIEVVELLWLACPHCFALEPTMKEYKKSLPDYIDFKQVPAMLNPRWATDAKTFYIAELLDPKGEKKLIDKLFNAIHVQKRKRMASPTVVKQFIMQQGITEEEYDNAANSMVLTAKLNRARQVSADSQANSVPSVIINGKYRTSPYAAGNEKKLLQIIEMLTKRELDKK
ncbi:thiol:disulfide interchange protein DsbA/DsbL [Leucothrix arctica]|uniref:Thioredoxin-like fold domain-containing protein n=1 Tax=Leucothrix arctica TaxID=1481894 RepID=A0A317C8D7_9GAMM|nr:thiol:disulfide interchange protein DsbA/DsbL [Leucothrix arctica]PWQ94844.1 hypothetical protein DKT75_13915 [Leucothrix arctica]